MKSGDAELGNPREMMAEGEENSIMNTIAELVDQFRGVHKAEGVENIEAVPEGDAEPFAATEAGIPDETEATDNEMPTSPTLDAEEEFVAAVRDALEGYGGSEADPGGVEATDEDEDLPAMDADCDLTGYSPEQLQGWIQKIEGELRNRGHEKPDDVDLRAGDAESFFAGGKRREDYAKSQQNTAALHKALGPNPTPEQIKAYNQKKKSGSDGELDLLAGDGDLIPGAECDEFGADANPRNMSANQYDPKYFEAEAKWRKAEKEFGVNSTQAKQALKEFQNAPAKKGQAMDAKMAVDAAVRRIKASTDAKNAAIALVEPLVGSVTKLMAMDSAEEILRFTLESHGETPPKNIGLAGLHGMVGMLQSREAKAKIGMDAAPKRSGVEAGVAKAVDAFRLRCRILD